MTPRALALAALLAVAAGPLSAGRAQEATNTPAATQPSQGKWTLREKLQYVRSGAEPGGAVASSEKFVATTIVAYGLSREWSASFELPVLGRFEERAGGGDEADLGLNDPAIALKWRPFQWDLGPVDSVRVAFVGGLELPLGTGEFSSHSWDPFAGAIFTAILGRQGVNAGLQYKLNTGGGSASGRAGDTSADALRYDLAYLWRLSPARYSADTTAATYLTAELNGLYETSGDHEVLVGPGLLYEARTFALEATLGLPIVRDVDHRARTNLVLTVGVRFLF